MANRIAELLLGVAGIAALTVPVVIRPQAQPAKALAFEVASVKVHDPPTRPFAQIKFGRGGLTLTEIDLSIGLTLEYGVRDYQIQGPDWLHFASGGGKFFDLVTKASGPVSHDPLRLMPGRLLAERFHLTFHREQKEMPVIALLVAKGGPTLHSYVPGTAMHSQWLGFDNMLQVAGPTGQAFTNTSMPALAMAVSARLGNADDRFAPNKATMQDDLGLTLQRRKAPIEMFEVDHEDKVPTDN